jgi:hypothetical protein
MAQRVDGFRKVIAETPRRYPWHEWTDGSIWEIRQGEDYDVPTENMRVNLHEHAKRYVMVVRTEKVSDGPREGLRFQFERAPLRSPIKRVGPTSMNPYRPQPPRRTARF